jgi:hypothetical protein
MCHQLNQHLACCEATYGQDQNIPIFDFRYDRAHVNILYLYKRSIQTFHRLNATQLTESDEYLLSQ